MTISHWPSSERPRERLMNQGAAALSDAELLAILLKTGVKGSNAVTLARTLLQHYGSLRGVFNASYGSLKSQPGLGVAKYCELQAALELCRRYLKESLEDQVVVCNTEAAEQFIHASLCHYDHEVFACLFLDHKNRVLQFEELFHGTINRASVHPREVVKRALQLQATAVIVAHNHPSGIAIPSRADRELTDQLGRALALVEIQLLDHIVVGRTQVTACSQLGWIKEYYI